MTKHPTFNTQHCCEVHNHSSYVYRSSSTYDNANEGRGGGKRYPMDSIKNVKVKDCKDQFTYETKMKLSNPYGVIAKIFSRYLLHLQGDLLHSIYISIGISHSTG